jgi:dihydroorotase
MSKDNITLPAPFDAHVHFRQENYGLQTAVVYHEQVFEYALAMPNTNPPILNCTDVSQYNQAILKYCKRLRPLLTIKLTPETTPQTIHDISIHSSFQCVAAKLYPEGVTTNSEGGFTRPMLMPLCKALCDVLDTMQEMKWVLCIHGEMPGEFCLDREKEFLYVLRDIAKLFPRLQIVLEHITTREAVEFVQLFKNVNATITLHHLMTTLDDVVGDKLNIHAFCKPIPKKPRDREYLIRAATSGDPKYFLGSDSAPHPLSFKQCGCAGCFTAPGLIQKLTELFVEWRAVNRLADFVSDFGRRCYSLPPASYRIELCKDEWTVPGNIGAFVPFLANQKMKWGIVQPPIRV